MDKSLTQKLEQSRMVIEHAFDAYPPEHTLIAWSAGKDSTLLLKLIIDVCCKRNIMPPIALDIDQNDPFEQLIAFRTQTVKNWNVQLMIVRNDDYLNKVQTFGDAIKPSELNDLNRQALTVIEYDSETVVWQPESAVINHLLKTVPINHALEKHNIKALFTGIRWDEHGARENETYFSQRDTPAHMRIHPLLHLTERDIWDSHFELNIPFTDLYKQGYRSLDTKHGTKKTSNVPAWEQDLDNTHEHGQRSAEKEKVMEQLRRWGYL